MTGDSAATARSEDVSDISSKGLLPQLIDVLHALTDGHESLARKVRDARLEYTRYSVPIVESGLQVEPADTRLSVGTSAHASIGVRRKPATKKVVLDTGETSVNGFGNGHVPEPSNGASSVPVKATVPEAVAPPDPAAIVSHAGTPAELSSEPSARTDGVNSARHGETTTAPVNRDYNFFDELDARLADRQDPADRSED
jgi:ubiquitin